MGQYHVLVNLDKREYVSPQGLGSGIKLWEMMASHPSALTALAPLLACSNGRGGGDLNTEYNWNVSGTHIENSETGETSNIPGDKAILVDSEPDKEKGVIGRWSGDRVAIVGDYGEADDLEWFRNGKSAADIYRLCISPQAYEEYDMRDERVSLDDLFTDITPLLRPLIEHELDGKFVIPQWMKDHFNPEPDESYSDIGYREWVDAPHNRNPMEQTLGALTHIVVQLKEDKELLNEEYINNTLERAKNLLNIKEATNGTDI
jgi:hypothetical protein